MAPGVLVSNADEEGGVRPSKKLKFVTSTSEEDAKEHEGIPSHPIGVKPTGNAYTSPVNSKTSAGFFSLLPDELLVHFLESLEARDLLLLGGTCRALYAFSRAEELWRALFVSSPPRNFEWLGTWRRTYLRLPAEKESRISCPSVFSDALYRPFQCAFTPLRHYADHIPSSNEISRMENLTLDEYSDKWSDKPFILTSPVKKWPIFSKWNIATLLNEYNNVTFRAEAVDWPLNTYISYMHDSHDESPLYLFDRGFCEKMNLKAGKGMEDAAYWPPECFGEDLFAVLGEQRPDSQWLIIGPERSGSTFHKDPNATSAWNAPLTGSKYWLMFPSGRNLPPPPGVILSDDASEITSPLSIAEYLLTFHEIARATPGCREGICHAGEVLHVPSGWFHLVLNLEDSIALTQNFVPRKKLAEVLRFLRDCPDQVSGFKDEVTNPYGLFVERLSEAHSDVLQEGLAELERKDKGGRGKWEEITKAATTEETAGFGFSFGFAGSDGDEDDAEIP